MRICIPVLSFHCAVAGLVAQSTCATTWQPGTIPGTSSPVNACVWWDPDGPGPRAQVLVVGGDFTAAGNLRASRIAAYDPQTAAWSTFGSGMDLAVTALCALPNGDLVAGGAFTTAGGQPCNRLARWNGSVWQPLGAGVNNRVSAVAARPNGNVVACGLFTTAGGNPVNYIAEWDGTTWDDMSGGVDYTPTAGVVAPAGGLLTLANGDVVAGGRFSRAGGVPVSCVARWNGTTWAPIGNGIPQLGYPYPINPVLALAQLPNGDLVAGGLFTQVGGVAANNLARWNGTTWSAMGSGATGGYVQALTVLSNGRVMAAGHITPNDVLEWNGTSWSPVANLGVAGLTFGNCLATSAGGIVGLGGDFRGLGNNVALRNGATWSAPSAGAPSPGYGFDSVVFAAARRGQTLIVGGAFHTAGGVAANVLAAWDGAAWSNLGAGFDYPVYPWPEPQISCLLARANGDIITGGLFTSPGQFVARWNGSTWAPLGAGTNSNVSALLETSTGDLVVGGSFTVPGNGIARWNGSTWSGLGSGVNGDVTALVEMPNGDLIAGGQFTSAGGVPASMIARWNGSTWQPLGSGVNTRVFALAVLADGSLVAAGEFGVAGGVQASRVARWNGTVWSAMGAGLSTREVRCLRVLPDGDLLAGGQGVAARWDGAGWAAADGDFPGNVNAFTDTPQGGVVAAGLFSLNAAQNVAYLTSSCPATSLAYGAGCAGAGGVDTLAADRLPWAGATFRATATGLPAPSVGFGVVGLVPTATPLASLVPQGLPGCSALVAPLSADLLAVAGGRATMGFSIPNAPYVVGVQFLAQVLTLETDLSGGLLAATSSNGLELTIGVF